MTDLEQIELEKRIALHDKELEEKVARMFHWRAQQLYWGCLTTIALAGIFAKAVGWI